MPVPQTALAAPLQVGAFNLPNRVVMAPLTRCRAAPGRVPADLAATYYEQRASAGLILTEATSVTPMGVGYPDTPGIWNDAQTEAWKKITAAVHARGGRIVLQLWHVGRISDPHYLEGAQPVAPSAIRPEGHVSGIRPMKPYEVPRALERSEIPEVVQAYRDGAARAKAAGFDGVEIHGANGYLVDQFLADGSNQRTDDYGGSVENRARFLLEVTDAVVDVWGADRVGVHLSPGGAYNGMSDSNPAETYVHAARELGRRGLAFIFLRETLDGPRLAPAMKEAFGGPVILNDSIDPDQGAGLVESGEADAVSWGRLYIANPDLAERLIEGAPLTEPNPDTFYGGGAEGYTDYPFRS
ncbi:alkene reductase [Actomonas aquatica]|uniref:Alkene reductase n=1 Tax=Actomonas aquatica TaxID=2866162 RepID=A0ABZ1C8C9_9BACT|nr:alkene reductase [Opitutus sp. WL0086]WRQ87829.1 alkene reductase [Opitutus sp. WL0086]